LAEGHVQALQKPEVEQYMQENPHIKSAVYALRDVQALQKPEVEQYMQQNPHIKSAAYALQNVRELVAVATGGRLADTLVAAVAKQHNIHASGAAKLIQEVGGPGAYTRAREYLQEAFGNGNGLQKEIVNLCLPALMSTRNVKFMAYHLSTDQTVAKQFVLALIRFVRVESEMHVYAAQRRALKTSISSQSDKKKRMIDWHATNDTGKYRDQFDAQTLVLAPLIPTAAAIKLFVTAAKEKAKKEAKKPPPKKVLVQNGPR
jgi:hypothetical protein